MKYYSTLRPVGPGTFPPGIVVTEIRNFDQRQYCPETDAEAWGWFETDAEISEAELKAYDLDPEGIRTWYAVTSCIMDDGRIRANVTGAKRCLKEPESSFTHTSRRDIYTDWFETREKADRFVEEARRA